MNSGGGEAGVAIWTTFVSGFLTRLNPDIDVE